MKLEKLPLTTFSPTCSKKLISPKNEQPNVLRLNIQRDDMKKMNNWKTNIFTENGSMLERKQIKTLAKKC